MVPANVAHYMVLSEIPIDHPITIEGAGPSSTVIDGSHNGRVFKTITNFGTTITISGVEITGGTGAYPGGGAVYADSNGASLTLVNDLIDNNQVTLGGYPADNLGGGAIKVDYGTLTLTNTTVSHNKVTLATTGGKYDGGGAILAPTLIATGSHIDSNTLKCTGPASDAAAGYGSGGGGVWIHAGDTNTISNSTIDNNSVTINSGGCCFGGGGIYLGGSAGAYSTTLANTTVSGNTLTVSGPTTTTADDNHCCSGGGGVWTAAGLTLLGASLTGNTATVTAGDCCHGGGGAYMVGDLQPSTFTDATISGNTLNVSGSGGYSGGGGILDGVNSMQAHPFASRLRIDSSTIATNQANITGGASVSGGGGLRLSLDAANSILNSTISDNTTSASGAQQGGGGVFAGPVPPAPGNTIEPQTLTLTNATIAGNSAPAGAGGAVLNPGIGVRSENSLLSLNTASNAFECSGFGGASFTSLGYNLTDLPNTCSFTAAGDKAVAGSGVGLGPLQNNLGPTETRALLPGSPAVNAGNPAGCADPAGVLETTDQRGLTRPFGGRCDIGAFELQSGAGPTGPHDGSGTVVPPSRRFSFALTGDRTGDIGTTIAARGPGKFAAVAEFRTKGSKKSHRFAIGSAATATPDVLTINLKASAPARGVLNRHEKLSVSVEVTFSPTAGGKVKQHHSIKLLQPKPPTKKQQERLPLLLEVTGTTTVSFSLDSAINWVVFSGFLNYTRTTDLGGRAVPPALGGLAREKCLAAFDAGSSLGPYPHGPHEGAKLWELAHPGFLVNLTQGTTTFHGNGYWSRLMFPGDRGKTMFISVGVLDPYENYVGDAQIHFKYRQHPVTAFCESVNVTRTYDGPQANHGS